MTQPVESPGRPAESKTAHQAGGQKAADVGDELGGRIRRRYLGSLGVLRLEATMGLARRVSRWGKSRLPLLATIQRRWLLAQRPLVGSASGLLYARSPVGGGSQPPSADSAQSMSEALDLTPLPKGGVGLQRAASAQQTTSPPPQHSMASQGRGAPKVQAASTVSHLGAAILRRHLNGPGARAVQRTLQTAQAGDSAEAEGLVSTTRSEASSRAGPQLSSGAGASPPAGGKGRPSGPVQAALPSPTASDNLGTAISQRHLTGPGTWVMRRQAVLPESAPPGIWISPHSFGPGRADAATPQISGRAARRASQPLPTAHRPASLQREIDERFPPTLAHITPTATGEGHTVENTAASGSRAGLTLLRRVWRPSSRATVPSGDTNVVRQLAPLVSRLPRSGIETTGVALGPRGGSYLAAPEMWLLRMAERGAKTAEDRVAAPDSRTSAGSGTTVDLLMRGAVTETSVAPPPTDVSGTASSPPAGEPSAPSEAARDTERMESIDLERLADQVYAIIERRLTIERESLGL